MNYFCPKHPREMLYTEAGLAEVEEKNNAAYEQYKAAKSLAVVPLFIRPYVASCRKCNVAYHSRECLIGNKIGKEFKSITFIK